METITKYKALDGVEFTNQQECQMHEDRVLEASKIMSQLPNRPVSCDFSNGSGFIQHDKEKLITVRNKILELAKKYSDHKWIQQTIDQGFEIDPSRAGRIIGECAPSSFYKHWHRFHCIDKSFKEWGQPYYATNPNEGKRR